MKNAQELALVAAEAARISVMIPSAQWFAFGSSITDAPMPADVDILVICATHDETMLIRRELDTLSHAFPLHLMLLTEQEEAELRFSTTQPCRPLSSLSRTIELRQ